MGDNGGDVCASMKVLAIASGVGLLAASWPAQAQSVTYFRDVAPIVRTHCTPCHRPNAAAPFSLVTYDEVRGRARLIAQVTARRAMPPWKPSAEAGGPFVGARRLSDGELATIARWVEQGAPEGERIPLEEPAPAAPWTLGTPDLIVTLPETYTLDADGPDVFRNFVVPIPVERLRYVSGVEFDLNGARVVHHANLRIDATSSSRELDLDDPLPGYEGPVGINARYPGGHVLGWTPGQVPSRVPAGTAWRLAPSSDLVMQLHLKKSGKPESVQPRVAFFFTDEAPTRTPLALRLGRQNIDLAPGQSTVLRDSYRLPVGVELLSIHPHAHSRATEIKAFAELPDGSRRWLLHIEDWDFNWQDVYRYEQPIALPQGSTVVMEFTYDNSSGNPRNPDSPPRRVLFGQSSADEMGDLWLQVVTASAQHRALLFRDIYPRTLSEDAVGYDMLLKANPTHVGYHNDLALISARLGRRDRAISHFETAIRLKPSFAEAHYNLATLYAMAGRLPDAIASLRTALALRPNHAETHNNLGAMLKARGQLDEAIGHFRRALELDPGNVEAQLNLKTALGQRR